MAGCYRFLGISVASSSVQRLQIGEVFLCISRGLAILQSAAHLFSNLTDKRDYLLRYALQLHHSDIYRVIVRLPIEA